MISVFKKFFEPLMMLMLTVLSCVYLVVSDYDNKILLYIGWIMVSISLVILIYNLHKVIQYAGRVFKEDDKESIKGYLLKWLQKGGNSVILTRDLSWVDGRAALEVITQKTRRNELIIIMPKANAISQQLQALGADIRYYENSKFKDFIISNRFTIIGWDTGNARMTVPTNDGGYHINEEYSGSDSIMKITTNLVKLILTEIPA